MANLWKTLCRSLRVLCGFPVENVVQKSMFDKFVSFLCGKSAWFAKSFRLVVNKYVCISGKCYQIRTVGFTTISTVST